MGPPPRRRKKTRARCLLVPLGLALTTYAYVVCRHFRHAEDFQGRMEGYGATVHKREWVDDDPKTHFYREEAERLAKEKAAELPPAPVQEAPVQDVAVAELYRGPPGCWKSQAHVPVKASIASTFTGRTVHTNVTFPSIAQQLAQRTLAPEESKCRVDFTLVTQASAERLWMLDHICQRWHGPIVIGVYAPITEKIVTQRDACYLYQVDYVLQRVKLHVYNDHSAYPVNTLRNRAIARVRTSHFLHADMDLWPDKALLSRLKSLATMERHNGTFADPKQAIVIAAFAREVKTDCASSTAKAQRDKYRTNLELCHREADLIPDSFDALKKCIISKDCHIFDRYNHDGHGTTDYRTWLRGFDGGKSLKRISCFASNRYEPYVVLRKSPLLPLYEERFTGYGKNKIEQIVHLRYAGWRFQVLGRSFLTHFPHHKSAARVEWEETLGSDGLTHRARMDALYREFLAQLMDAYGAPGSQDHAHARHTKICNT